MAGIDLFVYGTLQDVEILGAALGRSIKPQALLPATAPSYAAVYYPGRVYPALIARSGAAASGKLMTGLDAHDLAVLDAFEGSEYRREAISIRTGEQTISAQTYLPTIVIPPDAPDWTLAGWIRDHRPAVLTAEAGLAKDLRARMARQVKTD